MTMEISRLGIEVKSDGINEARKALDGGNGRGGLLGAAEKVEKSVTKLTDSMSKLLASNTSATAMAWNQSLSSLSSTMAALNSSVSATAKALKELTPALEGAEKTTERLGRAKREATGHSNVFMNTLKAMTAATMAYMSINFAKTLVQQADSWQMMTARLTNATGSMHNARAAQQQMFDLSQRLRVPLEESVRLYTRLAPSIQGAGKSSAYAKDMVEGIATALQLSGATGGEAASVMLQLSQSFSSGVLNGAEFNAVAENGSVLMRALEKHTGKATYELKKMGSEGRLSMDTVGAAIQASLPTWREQFDRLPMTFEGAMQRLKNAWTKAVGEMGESSGFNKQLSESLRVIEDMIPAVARGLGNAFIDVMKWISSNKEQLGQMWDQAVGLTKDVAKLIAQMISLGGTVAGVGQEISLWGFALYTTRGLLAALADGARTILAVLHLMGTALAKLIVLPMQGWLMIVEEILDGFAAIMRMAANAQRYLGKTDSAARLDGFADSANSAASTIRTVNSEVDGFLKASAGLATGWFDTLAKGEGSFAKWMKGDEIDQIMEAREKLRMDEEAWAKNNPAKNKNRVDPKAAKAAETAAKAHAAALEELNSKLKAQELLQANLAKSGLGYDKVTPEMKEVIRLTEHRNALAAKGASLDELSRANMQLGIAQRASDLATLNERTLERLRVEKNLADQQATVVKNLEEQADALERQAASYGQAKGAVEALALAEATRRRDEMAATSDGQQGEGFSERLAALNAEVAARERIVAASERLGDQNALKEFEKLFDARKAEKFGNVLAEGFGKAGAAIGKMVNAMQKLESRQAKIAQGRKSLNVLDKTGAEYAKVKAKLDEEAAEMQMASYADLAGAAKSFFAEGSKGYKAMEAAEKTFRVFQMAMQVKSFLQEASFLQAITALFVTSKATEVAATTATVAPTVTANIAKQSSNATTALTSALAAPFPANIAAFAVVAAMLASIGVAVGGGGGGGVNVSEQRQKSQGTGTVFGDSDAKSESISKSLEIVSKNSDIALRYSSGMLSSLQNIEYSLTGATSGVIRSGGVTGKGFEGQEGVSAIGKIVHPLYKLADSIPIVGKMISFMYGTTTNLLDSGLMGNSQSVKDVLQNGFNVSAYQDVQTKKKVFGITYSDKTSTNTSAADPAIAREFSNIVSGMVDSLTSAAGALGLSGETIRKRLEAVNIDIGKISLKDLTSEEIQKQLEAVFSAIGDTLAKTALPQALAFQKAGEGLLETVVRVATGVETANYELEKLGITAIGFEQITNKTGDVGGEIVRQSVLMNETSKGITEIISTLTGTAAEIAETYASLSAVRNSLQFLGIGADVTRELIRAAGGLESLQDALSSYTENFFTEAEQTAMKSGILSKEFAKLGVAMPVSNAAFRSLVETLMASGSSGQELAAKVLLLADSFAELNSTTDELISAARDNLSEAYERESDALTETKDKFQEFADSLKEFRSSLITGDLSTLNVAEKYAAEKARFEEVLTKARAGDATAIGSFEQVASSFLNASREMNASGAIYTADFQRVLAETDFISSVAQERATVAEQQLEALNKQVEGLITLNETVLTVAQAIQNLNALLGGSATPTAGIPVTPPLAQTASVQADMAAQNAALVASVQALQTEVATLRQEQSAQTSALIASNYEANMTNAAVVVDGTTEAVSISSYKGMAQTQLA